MKKCYNGPSTEEERLVDQVDKFVNKPWMIMTSSLRTLLQEDVESIVTVERRLESGVFSTRAEELPQHGHALRRREVLIRRDGVVRGADELGAAAHGLERRAGADVVLAADHLG